MKQKTDSEEVWTSPLSGVRYLIQNRNGRTTYTGLDESTYNPEDSLNTYEKESDNASDLSDFGKNIYGGNVDSMIKAMRPAKSIWQELLDNYKRQQGAQITPSEKRLLTPED